MKATLISYPAGMSGDFLSFLIHKDPKFYSIDKILVSKQNRWLFPNLLHPIKSESLPIEAKNWHSSKPWPLNEELLDILHKKYGDKNILLPTHWYNEISPDMTNGLFDQGIRFYTDSLKTLKIVYAMFWIKSHAIANNAWPLRLQEIKEMIDSDHPRKDMLMELLDSYHSWKFQAIRYNMLDNGRLDLLTYMKQHFHRIYKPVNINRIHQKNYTFIELDNLIYNDFSGLEILENYFDVNIDRNIVKEYTNNNLTMLNEQLKVSVDSDEFSDNDRYFELIKNTVSKIIIDRPYQFDYYEGEYQR